MSIREDLAGVGSPPPNLFLKALRENPRIVQMTGKPVSREHFITLLSQAYSEARAEALKSKPRLSEEEKKAFLEADAEAILEWFGNLPDDVKAKLLKLAPAQHEFYKWLRDSPQFRLMVAEAYKNIMYQREVERLLPELGREQFMEEYMKIPVEERMKIEEEIFGGTFMSGGSGEVKLAGKGRFITPLIPEVPEIRGETVKSLTEKIMEMKVPEMFEAAKQFLAGAAASIESFTYMLTPKHPLTRQPLIPAAPPPATIGGAVSEQVKKLLGLQAEQPQTEMLMKNPAYLAGNITGEILTGILIGKALGKLAARIGPPTKTVKVTDYIEYRSGSMVKRALKGEILEDPHKGVKPEEITGIRLRAVEYEAEGLKLGVKDVLGEQFTAMLKGVKDLRVTGPEEWLDIKWSLGPVEEYVYTKLLEQPTFQAAVKSLSGPKITFRDEARILGETFTPRLTLGKVEGFIMREAGEAGSWLKSFRGGGAETPLTLTQLKLKTVQQTLISIPKPVEGKLIGAAAAATILSPSPPRSTVKPITEIEEAAEASTPGTLGIVKTVLTMLKPLEIAAPAITIPAKAKHQNQGIAAIITPKPITVGGRSVEKPIKPAIDLTGGIELQRTGRAAPLKPAIKPQINLKTQVKIKMEPLTVEGIPLTVKPYRARAAAQKRIVEAEERRGRKKLWRYFEFINPFPEINLFGRGRKKNKLLL